MQSYVKLVCFLCYPKFDHQQDAPDPWTTLAEADSMSNEATQKSQATNSLQQGQTRMKVMSELLSAVHAPLLPPQSWPIVPNKLEHSRIPRHRPFQPSYPTLRSRSPSFARDRVGGVQLAWPGGETRCSEPHVELLSLY